MVTDEMSKRLSRYEAEAKAEGNNKGAKIAAYLNSCKPLRVDPPGRTVDASLISLFFRSFPDNGDRRA